MIDVIETTAEEVYDDGDNLQNDLDSDDFLTSNDDSDDVADQLDNSDDEDEDSSETDASTAFFNEFAKEQNLQDITKKAIVSERQMRKMLRERERIENEIEELNLFISTIEKQDVSENEDLKAKKNALGNLVVRLNNLERKLENSKVGVIPRRPYHFDSSDILILQVSESGSAFDPGKFREVHTLQIGYENEFQESPLIVPRNCTRVNLIRELDLRTLDFSKGPVPISDGDKTRNNVSIKYVIIGALVFDNPENQWDCRELGQVDNKEALLQTYDMGKE